MARLSPLSKNPRYFQDPAGYPVYLSVLPTTGDVLRTDSDDSGFFARLGRTEFNGILLDLDPHDRDPSAWVSPYKRSKGNARTPAGHRRFDLTAPNPAFWERISALLRRASQNHVFVLLSLFTTPLGPADWTASAWNPENNVNGDALGEAFTSGDPARARAAFYSPPSALPVTPTEAFLADRQRELIEAAVSAGEGSPNVFYSLANESASPEWVRRRAIFLDESTLAPFLLPSAFRAEDGVEKAAGFLSRDHPPTGTLPERKTLFHHGPAERTPNEPSPICSSRTAWKIFLQGAQWIYSPPVTDPSSPDSLLQPLSDKEAAAMGSVRRFIRERRVRYWVMAPRSTPEGRPYLARPDDRYLVYASGGNAFTLDLTGDSGSYTVAWWNVAEEYLTHSGALLAGRTREFTPPDAGEWVLDLYKKIR